MSICSINPDCGSTNCPLDSGFINAENSVVDDIDWRINLGPTPSADTGPDTDHTTGNSLGKYIYLEACKLASGSLVTYLNYFLSKSDRFPL